MNNKVFLGGTITNTNNWREVIINNLNTNLNYFNPVVKNWNDECIKEEINQKENECNIHLYVVTSEMTGVLTIAEVVNSVHNNNKITIFQVLPDGFSESQLKSFEVIIDMIRANGGIAYIDQDLIRTVNILNYAFSEN